MEGLSINYVDSTNKDVVVTYTPSSLVTNYSYVIIKNNEYGESNVVSSNTPVNIVFNETGTYKIEITNYDNIGTSNILTSGEYKIDKEAPIINIKEKTYKLKEKEEFSVMNGITASDIVDGDLTNSITTNYDELDFSESGIKKLEYKVSDKAGNITTEVVYLTVMDDNSNLVRFGQLGIILVLIAVILFLYKYIRSIKLEKRFSKYTINSSKNKSISLLDNLYNQYQDFVGKLSKTLSKSMFLKKRSEKYTKYIEAFELDNDTMRITARKVIIGVIYILIAAVAKLFQSNIISSLEILISFILGFYTLDLIYIYKHNQYQKKIEKDLLEAITVMNNAFKAGMSIIQAVELVSKELDGPIAKEFKKISLELAFGLDVEVVFKRFAERIKVEEAVYLTSSLSVLNKTGGNIIKVFDSIEKTMFSRKKLENEYKSLTSSSKMIMYVLIFVPIAFIAFIGLINKDYFMPLFTSPLGIILIIIMLIIYVTYIFIVRKVLKVRM